MKIRVKTPRKPVPTQPFLDPSKTEEEQYTPPGESAVAIDPMSSIKPVNLEMLDLGKKLRKKLPSLLEDKITDMRDFFLTELSPLMLAASNGLEDAQEALQNALGEETDSSIYVRRIERMLDVAVDIRILAFLSEYIGMTDAEKQLFTYLVFNKESSSDSKERLSKMLAIPDLPRSKESPSSQLRAVRADKGNSVDARAGRDGNRTRGGEPERPRGEHQKATRWPGNTP